MGCDDRVLCSNRAHRAGELSHEAAPGDSDVTDACCSAKSPLGVGGQGDTLATCSSITALASPFHVTGRLSIVQS